MANPKIDPTTRGGVIPFGDRMVVSRDRIARLVREAGQQAFAWSEELDSRYQAFQDEQACQEAAEKAAYAKGITDGLALLLNPDQPDQELAELLGWTDVDQFGRPLRDPVEDAQEAALEAQHQADLQAARVAGRI
jgi:hypothetical protein